jgi:2-iminobutanoate/2-iminopropanoate deaminase
MTKYLLRLSPEERTMRRLIAATAVVLAPAVASAQAPQFLVTNPQSTAPFSPAVKVGNMLYLAGQEGTEHGKLVAGGIGPETRQTLTNIKTVLEANGSDMEHVVKCTVFLADIKEWAAMNEVYKTFFTPGKVPARSAFGTSGLAQDARTEIECIAVVK